MQVMNCTESLTAQIYFADVAYYEKGIDDPDFPTAGAIGGGAGLALLNPADATAPCTQVADQDPAITQVPYEWDSTTGTCCIAPGQLLL